MSHSWHVEPDLLDRFANAVAPDAQAASVEAHLVTCDECRSRVGTLADRARLDRVWTDVVDTVDAPRPGVVEGLLRRLGVRDHTARLLAATPSLRLSWLAALAAALVFAVLAANTGDGRRGLLLFLALAPVLPVAGVAVAFGPGVDPGYEITLASPLRSFKLLLLRSTAVLTSTLLLIGAATLALPQGGWLGAAWLLPALALALATLALSTVVPAPWAAGGLVSTWLAAVLVGTRWLAISREPGAELASRVFAFTPTGQFLFLVLAAAAALTLAFRREDLEFRRTA